MQHVKTKVIVLIVCIIVVVGLIMFKNHRQNIKDQMEANFHVEAIVKFWENEDLYEQAKEHLFALPNDLYSLTIYYDNDSKRFIAAYNNFEINDDFERSLSNLYKGLKPMSLHVIYGERIEKSIRFELGGGISRKGIMYIINNDEEEIKNQTWIRTYQQIKDNWYYYEEMAGV